ncbi:Protein of unknown function [Acinetobacter marinus]|uniref:DUF3142 domain-containing protein n=2 Tax=Acinetobacter marinus TaxID=281375 RepID=A0A1G6GU19_9GAMM|nr:DUF3142 domain-containing protein [Acinetobacter marinus]SDB85413.1 Protein of unknown function [Acinetobacter marinus]
MPRKPLYTALASMIMLCGCTAENDAPPHVQSQHTAESAQNNKQNSTGMINPAHYQEFWLWGNIAHRTYLDQAKQLYILQGEVALLANENSQIDVQGMSPRQLDQPIWIVFRSTHINWTTDDIQHILRNLELWKKRGNQVVGLQVDFDSGSKNLYHYASFLKQLRQQLPAEYRLSITGLLDWVNYQSPQTIDLLNQSIDEVVLQTYQQRHSIANSHAYLPQLKRLKVPFKIGLVEHGQMPNLQGIEQSAYFRGYIIFLLPEYNP